MTNKCCNMIYIIVNGLYYCLFLKWHTRIPSNNVKRLGCVRIFDVFEDKEHLFILNSNLL